VGITAPHIFFGRVMHQRLWPRRHGFVYRIYYLALPLAQLATLSRRWWFAVNRPALLRFDPQHYGARHGDDLTGWAEQLLAKYGVPHDDCSITLLTMPKILGYGFNPVSFWLVRTSADDLRAVICEVNNTFGESHSYLCRPTQGASIAPTEWLRAEKVFHVSPFLPRDGSYRFRFYWHENAIRIAIHYHAVDGRLQLITTLVGKLEPLTQRRAWRAFWAYPFITFSTIARIHWHAFMLWQKRQRFYKQPPQQADHVSATPRQEE
jgi:uncharacterized protein